MKKGAKPRRKTDDNTITFRLPPDEFLELVQRGDRLGISRHLLGQHYVTQMLNVEYDHSNVVAVTEHLANNITELRKDVAIAVEALLLASGQYSEEDARGWVKSQFKILIPNVEPTET
jgi:hypothetical protein